MIVKKVVRKITEKINELIKKISKSRPLMFFDQLFFRIQDHNVLPLGGQLAYFLILSIFPFIMVFLNILSKTTFIQEQYFYDTIHVLPVEVQDVIVGFIDEVVSSSSQGLLSIAIILAILSASSGVRAIIRGINNAYGKKEARSFISLSIISIFFTVMLLILLITVFATLVFGQLIGQLIFNKLGLDNIFNQLWERLRFVIPILFMIFLFALLYKLSPAKKHQVRLFNVLPGAVFTTLGWIIISYMFAFYVNNFANYGMTYGSLVGIIIMLIWLYLSSVIILIGGEINATLKYFNDYGYVIDKNNSLVYFIKK